MSTDNYQAQKGDLVTIDFIAKIKDKDVEVMSSQESEPFSFVIGEDSIFPKLGDALLGMKLNESKDIELAPDDAFGQITDDLIYNIKRSKLPEDIAVGVLIGDTGDENAEWLITSMDDDSATLDGNHPLAGETLVFSIKVIELEPAASAEDSEDSEDSGKR